MPQFLSTTAQTGEDVMGICSRYVEQVSNKRDSRAIESEEESRPLFVRPASGPQKEFQFRKAARPVLNFGQAPSTSAEKWNGDRRDISICERTGNAIVPERQLSELAPNKRIRREGCELPAAVEREINGGNSAEIPQDTVPDLQAIDLTLDDLGDIRTTYTRSSEKDSSEAEEASSEDNGDPQLDLAPCKTQQDKGVQATNNTARNEISEEVSRHDVLSEQPLLNYIAQLQRDLRHATNDIHRDHSKWSEVVSKLQDSIKTAEIQATAGRKMILQLKEKITFSEQEKASLKKIVESQRQHLSNLHRSSEDMRTDLDELLARYESVHKSRDELSVEQASLRQRLDSSALLQTTLGQKLKDLRAESLACTYTATQRIHTLESQNYTLAADLKAQVEINESLRIQQDSNQGAIENATSKTLDAHHQLLSEKIEQAQESLMTRIAEIASASIDSGARASQAVANGIQEQIENLRAAIQGQASVLDTFVADTKSATITEKILAAQKITIETVVRQTFETMSASQATEQKMKQQIDSLMASQTALKHKHEGLSKQVEETTAAYVSLVNEKEEVEDRLLKAEASLSIKTKDAKRLKTSNDDQAWTNYDLRQQIMKLQLEEAATKSRITSLATSGDHVKVLQEVCSYRTKTMPAAMCTSRNLSGDENSAARNVAAEIVGEGTVLPSKSACHTDLKDSHTSASSSVKQTSSTTKTTTDFSELIPDDLESSSPLSSAYSTPTPRFSTRPTTIVAANH